MSRSSPSQKRLRTACASVVELATLSLRPEYLRWERQVNLGAAELIWNYGGHDLGLPILGPVDDPAFAAMCEHVARVRRDRWPDEDFMVVQLEAHTRQLEIVFQFELTFDEGRTFHPCEIVWDPRGVQQSTLN